MDTQQKQLVQKTWAKVVPISETTADLFYGRLFEMDPAIQRMFSATNMKKQGQMLVQALALTVRGLDTPDKLIPVLEDLGRRHAKYGVHDAHYDTFGSALLWTLEKGLGDAFTPAVKGAWTEAYTLVASVMKAAARKLAA
jgi:hemoglobin-like flavoprotein